MTDDALLDSLRARVQAEVGRVVRPGPVALLDFPNYENPGDNAIWLGALACLSALGFDPPVYTSDDRTFDERMLRRRLPTGTILLTGGGTLGDLWPRHQAFRERIVRGFPHHAIVQLPQTIHFDDENALAGVRRAFVAHEDLTLLVRDPKSLDLATSHLGCRASLCPDLAFSLRRDWEPVLREAPDRQRHDILRLLRTDHEAGDASSVQGSRPAVDWIDDVESPLRERTRRFSDRLATTSASNRKPSVIDYGSRALLSASYPRLARQRLARGSRLLQSARVVVTDRLHGHILALILGIPHVVVGDRNGKVRAFVETWTASAAHLRWANTRDEGERLAVEWLSCC